MLKTFKRPFKGEESRFILSTGLKVLITPTLVSLFIAFQIWIMVRMNLVFFESHGLPNLSAFQEAYYDFIFRKVAFYFAYVGFFFVALFFFCAFLGEQLVKPFENLGKYCEKVIINENEEYVVDTFSQLRVLTRFSDYFFTLMASARAQKKLHPAKISSSYARIHKPVFDKVFFFHFSLFLCTLTVIIAIFFHGLAVEIHSSIVEFAISTVDQKTAAVSYYLNQQTAVLETVLVVAVVTLMASHFMLAIHLYGTVSGAAFGIFSTMRSYAKGNHSARVHLIGYAYLRPFTRSINQYLDFMQKNFAKVLDKSTVDKG